MRELKPFGRLALAMALVAALLLGGLGYWRYVEQPRRYGARWRATTDPDARRELLDFALCERVLLGEPPARVRDFLGRPEVDQPGEYVYDLGLDEELNPWKLRVIFAAAGRVTELRLQE